MNLPRSSQIIKEHINNFTKEPRTRSTAQNVSLASGSVFIIQGQQRQNGIVVGFKGPQFCDIKDSKPLITTHQLKTFFAIYSSWKKFVRGQEYFFHHTVGFLYACSPVSSNFDLWILSSPHAIFCIWAQHTTFSSKPCRTRRLRHLGLK